MFSVIFFPLVLPSVCSIGLSSLILCNMYLVWPWNCGWFDLIRVWEGFFAAPTSVGGTRNWKSLFHVSMSYFVNQRNTWKEMSKSPWILKHQILSQTVTDSSCIVKEREIWQCCQKAEKQHQRYNLRMSLCEAGRQAGINGCLRIENADRRHVYILIWR